MESKGKKFLLTLMGFESLAFSYDNTDSTRAAVLEQALRDAEIQRREQLTQRVSGLADILHDETKSLVQEIERNRGHGLDVREAWLLSSMVQKFGPERSRQTIRQMSKAKDPLRAAFAALQKGIRGQGAKQVESEPFEKVTYRVLE